MTAFYGVLTGIIIMTVVGFLAVRFENKRKRSNSSQL